MSTDITLTRAELGTLTGVTQPKRMSAWLRDNGWVFETPRGRGVPQVDRAYYLARMSGQAVGAVKREKPRLDFMIAKV